MSEQKYLTVKEVAEELRVSRQAVYDWINAGQLRAVRAGDRVRIPREALDEFVKPVRTTDILEYTPDR
jgi:excisionase family DNA binding protein